MTIDHEGVREIVAEIWESMLGLGIDAAPAAVDDGGREVCAAVQITGAWEGAFLLECPEASARRFATAMLGYDGGELPSASEVHDVIGELANMAGGNLKAAIGGESRLSLPTVAAGTDLDLNVVGATEVVRTDYTSDGAPFSVVGVARSV